MKKDSVSRMEIVAVCAVTFSVLSYFFHDLQSNPQPTTDVIVFFRLLINAVKLGTLDEYYLGVRKYPLLYTLTFSPAYLGAKTIASLLSEAHQFPHISFVISRDFFIHVFGRLYTVVFGVGTYILLWKVSAQQYKNRVAPLLLASSILFALFFTAIRPHVPVAFWTLLAYWLSLQLAKNRSRKNILASFSAATIAFCTLQNGLFAFVFPIWGYLVGNTEKRKLLSCFLILCICGFVSLCIGYTFLWNLLLGIPQTATMDLGHGMPMKWTMHGFWVFLITFLGSELCIAIAAVAGVRHIFYKKLRINDPLVPILILIGLYLLCFGAYYGSRPRYLIQILPLLCVLGASAPLFASQKVRMAVCIFVIILHGKMGYLGLKQNTYQLASAYLTKQNGSIATDLNKYRVAIPTTRLVGVEVEHEASWMLRQSRMEVSDKWKSCAEFSNGTWSKKNPFLWQDVDWPLLLLLPAKRMGANLTVYCRK